MNTGGWVVWGIVFIAVLGLYLYVKSRRVSKKK